MHKNDFALCWTENSFKNIKEKIRGQLIVNPVFGVVKNSSKAFPFLACSSIKSCFTEKRENKKNSFEKVNIETIAICKETFRRGRCFYQEKQNKSQGNQFPWLFFCEKMPFLTHLF